MFFPPSIVQLAEKPFQFVLIGHGKKDYNNCHNEKHRKTVVLLMADETPPKCKKQCSCEPSCRTDYQEFPDGKMPETEDVAENILRRSRYQKKKEDEKSPLVMEEIIITFDCLFTDKFFDKRTSERL